MKDILLIILYIIPCFIISSAIHELGHVLMGLKEGFRFHLLVAGPFGLKRNEKDNIVFFIEKNPSLWGGLGATLPTEEDIDNYKKFGCILLAGPITSLLFGAIFLPLGIITDNILLLLLGAIPLSMGIATLIPLRSGAFYTDGGRYLRMNKNEDTKAMEVALWNIIQNVSVQGNCKNLNFDDIIILINDEDMRTKYIGHFYAYNYYKDNDDEINKELQKEELRNLKEKVPKQMLYVYKLD